jgi:hypothetical protein
MGDRLRGLIDTGAIVVFLDRAQRENLDVVFTIDHDDFETYRIHGKRRCLTGR